MTVSFSRSSHFRPQCTAGNLQDVTRQSQMLSPANRNGSSGLISGRRRCSTVNLIVSAFIWAAAIYGLYISQKIGSRSNKEISTLTEYYAKQYHHTIDAILFKSGEKYLYLASYGNEQSRSTKSGSNITNPLDDSNQPVIVGPLIKLIDKKGIEELIQDHRLPILEKRKAKTFSYVIQKVLSNQ
ncbi:unnamed protein product [Arabis nemorensis]|uniref:Uncharacterized protein n=1 Tax=Arabis nemorensis TaxID=586526 RepID=A0A565AX37_9BRAS|nr:unnamed protein product [Arabis nemorensis]